MRKKIDFVKAPVAAAQTVTTTEPTGSSGSTSTPPMAVPAPSVLLRLPQVLARFPVSRSAWYEGVKNGLYPGSHSLSKRSVAWSSDAIDALIARHCATSTTASFNATTRGTK